MTERRTKGADSPASLDRRAFLTTLSLAISGPLAGCSGETKNTAPNLDESHDPPEGSGTPDEVSRIEGKIKQVYDRLEDVHLIVDGELVYDLENSVESVDYDEMIETAKDAVEAAEELDQDDDVSTETRNNLQRIARIAFLLVDQRFLVHRVLLGGMVFRRAFSDGKYGRAVEVMDESWKFLERLRANGGELEREVAGYEDSDFTMSELDAPSVTSDLEVILEILHWSIPVFEGFEYTATGMVVVQEGYQELEEGRYGPAKELFDQARKHFTRAEAAFNTAHGRGQALTYLMPLVKDLRCFVPSLATGYDDLDGAFSELESGNEEKGLDIARETLSQLDEEFRRCM